MEASGPQPTVDLVAEHQPGFGSDVYLGLVRAIGTDLSDAITALKLCFRRAGYPERNVEVIKLSTFFPTLLANAATREGLAEAPVRLSTVQEGRYLYYMTRMDAGDWLRASLGSDILAQRSVAEVRRCRPDGPEDQGHRGTVFIFDSLMHPAEVDFLRSVYGRCFFLIAVHSTAEHRSQHLFDEIRSSDPTLIEDDSVSRSDLSPDGRDQAERERSERLKRNWEAQVETLMRRDEGLAEPRSLFSPAPPERRVVVRRTFSDADVFITLQEASDVRSHKRLGVIERFVEKLFGEPFHTPTRAELGMAHAYVAARRSGSLSRPVGAAICTPDGDVLGIGVNDVPAAGGGHYWPRYDGSTSDHRDYLYEMTLPSGEKITGFDSNDRIKRDIFFDLMVRAFSALSPDILEDGDQLSIFSQFRLDPARVVDQLVNDESVRTAQFFDVIEYSRTVHAEMSALMACARQGISTKGAILYCTTFPCHECSRHIIAAGFTRVVYVEPYSKSRVASLHSDSVVVERFTGPAPLSTDPQRDPGDSHVRFEPFIGFSPNRHQQLYSYVPRKIDGKVSDSENLGRKKHWELGPNCSLRTSISAELPVARLAEEIMVKTSEEYIISTLEGLRLLEEIAVDDANTTADNAVVDEPQKGE